MIRGGSEMGSRVDWEGGREGGSGERKRKGKERKGKGKERKRKGKERKDEGRDVCEWVNGRCVNMPPLSGGFTAFVALGLIYVGMAPASRPPSPLLRARLFAR